MGSLKRKYARNRAKRAQKEIKQQLTMFGKLGDKCDTCEEPYDKKSKEHAMTWSVVVREKEKVVRLYCPECWGKANKIIKELENDLGIHKESRCESPGESQPE